MTKTVSVVVPVYNTAPYLRECLDSLVAQTIGNGLEVLLIDDGSTDGSGDICDDYAIKYPNIIKAFHKPNGGSASAREMGWQKATGTYITVCDSDDWVESDMYSTLLTLAQQQDADMVICDMFYNYSDGKQVEIHTDYGKQLTSESTTLTVLTNNTCGSTWNKLSRRRFFSDFRLHWEEGVNLGEDALMLLKYLQIKNLKIIKTDRCLYHYRRRAGENTYTNNITFQKWQQLQKVHNWKLQNLNTPEYSPGIVVSAIDLAFAYLRTNDSSIKFKDIDPANLNYSKIINAKSRLPKRVVILLYKTFGRKSARLLVELLYKFFYN